MGLIFGNIILVDPKPKNIPFDKKDNEKKTLDHRTDDCCENKEPTNIGKNHSNCTKLGILNCPHT
jgi:hypothetical protein